jgi:hypothetical protein
MKIIKLDGNPSSKAYFFLMGFPLKIVKHAQNMQKNMRKSEKFQNIYKHAKTCAAHISSALYLSFRCKDLKMGGDDFHQI